MAAGEAQLNVRLEGWKAGKVNPTTHTLHIEAGTPGPKPQPVTKALLASLPHTERRAGFTQLQFLTEGKQLLAAGYPSGVVQVFDVARRKELGKIAVPRAELDPDYASVGGGRLFARQFAYRYSTEMIEGKSEGRVDYLGTLLSWELPGGKPCPPLLPEKGAGIMDAKVSPDGRWVLSIEARGYRIAERAKRERQLYRIEREKGTKTRVEVFPAHTHFFPDSTQALITTSPAEEGPMGLVRLDLAQGKIVARRDFEPADGDVLVRVIVPDGGKALVTTTGKKGGQRRLLLIETRTLKTLATLSESISQGVADPYTGSLDTTGKRFQFSNDKQTIHILNLETLKEEHVFRIADRNYGQQLFSPDGKHLLALWQPAGEEHRSPALPDPVDVPQPRLSIFLLRDPKAKPRLHFLPPGYLGAMAFSPDGKMLAIGGAGEVHLLDWTSLISPK